MRDFLQDVIFVKLEIFLLQGGHVSAIRSRDRHLNLDQGLVYANVGMAVEYRLGSNRLRASSRRNRQARRKHAWSR